ncbi:MAG: hypothetical protein M1812_001113 [Candelaria pacifica]|nr:MAG: hypothetical protein M1812_001113 [Candelaria pacifica]
MHKLVEVTLGGKLNLAPIPENPKRILDVGTGTGVWAIEIGDKYPSAKILGNDLSPIQPRWVPENVKFEVDDVEAQWAYPEKFDYIHCRFMGIAVKDWSRLACQCFENTLPGGWVEFIDLDLAWQSPDGSLTEDHASLKFNHQFLKASRNREMEPSPGPLLQGYLKDAGFSDIEHEKFVWPVGTWPADKHLKEVGAWNYLQIMEGLEAFTFALFTRQLGYSHEEVQKICSDIRKEMKDPKMHAFFHLYVALSPLCGPQGSHWALLTRAGWCLAM